jgi:ATP-dependent exoDNAse (exonuclease V) alpha subunit
MAIFRMQISSVARSAGRRATAAAAYRAGERIRDDRSGELHNYSRRRDVLHTEILLPSQFDGMHVTWARNRERLWNTAEHAEKRHNSRVAREYQLSLPVELDAGQRLGLARSFAREIAERYKVAVDLAVHEPRSDGDPRNFHAHLLTTTREVTPAGLGAKAGLDMSPLERRRHELPDHRQEFINIRERWATLTNQALHDANVSARVDHRSLAAQGIDREPLPAIPLMHLKMEQRGVPSGVAERLRTEYRARVQMRELRAAARLGNEPPVTRADTARASRDSIAQVTDVEEIRRQAREAWLLLRSKEADQTASRFRESVHGSDRATAEHDTSQSESQARDDLAL